MAEDFEKREEVETEEKKGDKKAEIIRAVKFLLFSMSAGIVQILLFTLLNEIFHLSYWISYLVGLVASVIWNFTFNRKFTFKSATNVPIAMLKVFAYYAVFTPLSTLFVNFLTKIGWNEYLVTVLNMFINMVTEFIYQRLFVFKNSIDTNKSAQKKAEKEEK